MATDCSVAILPVVDSGSSTKAFVEPLPLVDISFIMAVRLAIDKVPST